VLHLKGLVGQVDRGIRSGASARVDVQTPKRRGMDSDSRMAGSEDGEVADKGRRSLLRHGESPEQYGPKGAGCQCLFSV